MNAVSPVASATRTVLLAVLGLAACSKAPAPPPAQPEVGIVAVTPRAVVVTTELPGRTSAFRVSQVRARVDGIVLKRTFTEGADVRQGQLLFQIDPAPYQAALASAQAGLLKAQANLAATTAQAGRYKVLVDSNAVSRQDYDNAVAAQGQASADLAAARAAVQTATINLGYTEVVAPVSGRIGTALVTEGAYVQASAASLLATIQQLDPMFVDLNQSSVEGLGLRREVAAGRLRLNGPHQAAVRLTLEDGSAYPQAGRLEFTDVTVDPGTGSVVVRALVPNPARVLLPGMFVHAVIDQGVNEQTLLVPQIGVTHDTAGNATVLLVGEDNKVVSRIVKTGRTLGSDWVIESGLKSGDRIIVEGGQKVQLAQTVTPVAADHPQGRSVSASIVVDPLSAAPSAPVGTH